MWVVMYNGITGGVDCEPYSDSLADTLAWMFDAHELELVEGN